MAARSVGFVCASGAVRRISLRAGSWRPAGGVSLHGQPDRGLDRSPAPHLVCRFHSRGSDIRRDLGMARVSEARSSLRSPGQRGHEGHGHPLQHDRPYGRAIHLCPPGYVPPVHHVAHQPLLFGLRGHLSAPVHRRDHSPLHVFLFLGRLERGEEGSAHRLGSAAESCGDHHAVRHRRSDVVHEYAGQSRGHLAGGVSRDRDPGGQNL